MRRDDLKRAVAKETGLTDSQADHAVRAVFTAIESALAEGDEVTVSGFGSFRVAERPAREGLHPQTRKPMKIDARRVGLEAWRSSQASCQRRKSRRRRIGFGEFHRLLGPRNRECVDNEACFPVFVLLAFRHSSASARIRLAISFSYHVLPGVTY